MERTAEDKEKINRFLGSAGLGQLTDPGLISQIGFIARKKIKSHEQFRRWIEACEPEKRRDMYEAMKPYMNFDTLKPLDVYEAEMRLEAEVKQLPIWEDGKFRAFNPANISGESELDRLAREAIEKASDELDDSPEAAALRAEVRKMNKQPREKMVEVQAKMLPNGEIELTHYPVNPTTGKSDLDIANEAINKAVSREHLHVFCSRCTKEDWFDGWDRKAAVENLRWWGWRVNPTDPTKELCPKCAE